MQRFAPIYEWVPIILLNAQDYCWFGLGGNCGDVRGSLKRSRTLIESMGSGPLCISRLYRSEPWGYSEQDEFINQVVGIEPNISVDQALRLIQEFERNEGRERTIKWGPRTIDVDILYWPKQIRNEAKLTLPHPRLHQRRFVLEPWVELAPDLVVQGLDHSLKQLLKICPDTGWLEAL